MEEGSPPINAQVGEEAEQKNNLNDMLQELRILLQGAQVLTAFLTVLPFSAGFPRIQHAEKIVYLVTFLCSICSLVLFSAPAVHHRLNRPLLNRERFKEFATRMMIIGLIPLSIALILATQLVISEVIGTEVATFTAIAVGLLIGVTWWLLPLFIKKHV